MNDLPIPPAVREFGDRQAAAALRPAAWRELATMRRQNVNDLDAVSRTVRFDDGRVIVCRRLGSLEQVHLYAPPVRDRRFAAVRTGTRPQPAPDGHFYVIPSCLARYDGVQGLQNAIADGLLADWVLGTGNRVSMLPFDQTGLPDPGVAPLAGWERSFNAFSLPGGEGSGLLYGPGHIPTSGAFSLSCLFRLTSRLDYDYTFDDRGVFSPVRPYVLQSLNGETFTWTCPGSLSPVVGFCEPDFHPGWSEEITYPWAPWNEDFSRRTETLTGIKRVSQACPDAPLLAPNGAAASPYRDAREKAYPHPHGFVAGMRAAGLFVADGDRLLAGRISDFSTQYGFAPILTPSLDLGAWHHAVLSYAGDGATVLYLAAQGQEPRQWAAYETAQPVGVMAMDQGYAASGVNSGYFVSDRTGERISGFRMNAAMDVALVRFFHHALDADQARLLHYEAFYGEFVADEFEAGPLAALGLTPIVIGRHAQ